MAVALVAASVSTRGATLRARDGKTYSGEITAANGQFSIATGDGKTAAIAPADVAAIDFRASAGPTTRLSTAPADQTVEAGSGLRGEYFSDKTFSHFMFYRGDPRIDFNFAAPNEIFPRKQPNQRPDMSIRWTGRIRPRFSERYTFFAPGYAAERLLIDHRLVFDFMQEAGVINLQAGHYYDLQVDWIVRRDDAVLEWASDSQSRQVVPGECLFPPRDASAMPPTATLTDPSDGAVFSAPANVPMSVRILPGSSTPVRVAYRVDGTLIGVAKTAPFGLVWPRAAVGDHHITATVTDADRTVGTSDGRHVIVASDAQQALPKSWVTCDVPPPVSAAGPSAPANEAPTTSPSTPPVGFHDGTLTVKATGGDVYAQDDGFQFVFHRLVGDGSIIARVASLSADRKGARPIAGVMIRTAVTASSPYVALLTQSGVGDLFLFRQVPDDNATNTSTTGEQPVYLKLTRKGYVVRSYRSADGHRWEFMGETRIDIPPSMLVGVITCSGDPNATSTATFDHLAVTTAADEATPPFRPAVVLTDGTRLVGTIARYEKDSAVLAAPAGAPGPVATIPRDAIARILFRPLPPDALSSLTPGQTGVFLDTGDFYAGDIESLSADRLSVNSVVFGPRDFGLDNLSAIILHPVAQRAGIEVELSDGSTIHSSSMSVNSAGIHLHTAAGDITAPLKDVLQIAAH
ncbi:MAG TPA: Ig-like domain-containing protein [Tepidisphaeraceae bacterium]|nr:Ig-like domain-containing protein [Tepidisphaeraceae bacterium]